VSRPVDKRLRRLRRAPEPGPYWKQRSWQWSAGFLGLVVLVGGFIALTSGGDDANAAADGPLSHKSGPRNSRPQGCRTDDSAGSALPESAPKDITWHRLGVGRIPVSASAGPTRTDGPVHWCFAHTPVGAALAATVIPSQMSGSGWETVCRQQVVEGNGRKLFEFQRSAYQDIDSAADTGGGAVGSYAGFSVTSYTSGTAKIRLLLTSTQGYGTTTIVVRWSDGDWKLVPTDDGSLYTTVAPVEGSPSGYIPWGGTT
jgi:hypothetical protein